MPILQSDNFEAISASAEQRLFALQKGTADEAARVEQWRREEWHNWFRWRLCRKGFDWSKPLWIGLLAAGFISFWLYGSQTGRLYVTAAGVVAWFTLVNLGFFTYFGLTLPGPPRAVPGPFAAGQRVRAVIGIYPAGYERRKLARVLIRVPAADGEHWLIELAFPDLPDDLRNLVLAQSTHRMQRGDAPATSAVIEALPVTRAEIDSGKHPVKVVAWYWNDQSLETFAKNVPH